MKPKPYVHVNINLRKYNRYEFETYQELKKNLPFLIKESMNNEVFVFRSKTQDAVCYEYWSLNDKGKAILTREGCN